MSAPDHLRPPSPGDPAAPAYKDWLHLNVFDHARDRVGLVNLSLHGPARTPSSLVVATALVESPATGWVGNVVTRDRSEASVHPTGIATDAAAVALDETGGVLVSVARAIDGLVVRADAQPNVDAFAVQRPQRFGSGWIGWRVVPCLELAGSVTILDDTVDLAGSRAYHDHNWGRWRWGEDIGWEWGSFVADDGTALVLARTTDRAHVLLGPPTLVVDGGGGRRVFRGRRVELRWAPPGLRPARRLPGALAALRADRAAPKLPRGFELVADDGADRVSLTFTARSAAQLILADHGTGGTSFLHQLAGTFIASARVRGVEWSVSGLAVVERLE